MQYKSEYDPEANILITKFIGTPKSFEDAEFMARKNLECYKELGDKKVWQIVDISEMGIAQPKYIGHFSKLEARILGKYVIDYCTVCSNTMDRIAVRLYNVLVGKPKQMIFANLEKAREWIFEQQKFRREVESIE